MNRTADAAFAVVVQAVAVEGAALFAVAVVAGGADLGPARW